MPRLEAAATLKIAFGDIPETLPSESAGARTQDLRIKSPLLYRLSYALFRALALQVTGSASPRTAEQFNRLSSVGKSCDNRVPFGIQTGLNGSSSRFGNEGECIHLIPSLQEEYQTTPLPNIILETSRLVAINKPNGLATQAPSGIDCAEFRVRRWLEIRHGALHGPNNRVYVGVPHRLDRATSGVLVFARDKRAAAHLARQFHDRTVQKSYRVIVSGRVDPPHGEWSNWMRKIVDEARAEICDQNATGAQIADLRYRTLNGTDALTLLEIEPATGRSHQIRLQASSRGHPVLGDSMYGSGEPFGPRTDDPRLRAIALHAERLVLTDPESNAPIELSADTPEFWLDIDAEFHRARRGSPPARPAG